jgi:CHAD domain-containing protein/CYTH domain-containing protein
MHDPVELLPLPAKHAARVLALRLLDEAEAAAERLSATDDPEALHDYRVALRRLRSLLRAHRKVLRGSVPKKASRRLRDVARATGTSRDAEVHLAWLAEQRATLGARRRVGVQWLMDRIEREKEAADAELLRETAKDFDRVKRTLRKTLAVYTTTVRLDAPGEEAPYAELAAALIERHARELAEHLGAVHTAGDDEEAHEARIAGKRLRYLLEPLAEEVDEVKRVVKRLKGLQDLLGELHDTHVFCGVVTEAMAESAAEQARRLSETVLGGDGVDANDPEYRRELRRDARPGLLALARLLRDRERAVFARIEAEWLGDAGAPFFEEVRAAAREIAAHSRRDREIERKFLLNALPDAVREVEPKEIEQGYLPGERLVERLRRVRKDGAERCYRTVKLGAGLSRVELEEEARRDVFDAMWPLTEGRRVRKHRYAIADGALTWEIDEFTDRELVLAEVELPSEGAEAEPPEWLRPYVVREVTGESEYVNAKLAM